MDLFRAVYTSRPFGFDSGVLSSILLDARRLNARDNITGALICRADVYLQLLEGPETQIRNTLDRIRRDDRHVEVTLHVEHKVTERMFGNWAMLHDPVASWIWTQKEVDDGAIERTTPDEIMEFFIRLRDLQDAGKAES